MILAKRPRSDESLLPAALGHLLRTVLACRGAVVSNAHDNDCFLIAPPRGSLGRLLRILLRTALLRFTDGRGSAKLQGLTKIGLTRGCSSPRKSLVKGERLVRYEEKPERVQAAPQQQPKTPVVPVTILTVSLTWLAAYPMPGHTHSPLYYRFYPMALLMKLRPGCQTPATKTTEILRCPQKGHDSSEDKHRQKHWYRVNGYFGPIAIGQLSLFVMFVCQSKVQISLCVTVCCTLHFPPSRHS